MFANSGNVCYSYKVVDGRVQRKVADRLHNDHEEAVECFTILQRQQFVRLTQTALS